jgi:L,D-peptidoglycan transpeptidase YkuD (ErfK/YbiS/YcfS/YnhG family)
MRKGALARLTLASATVAVLASVVPAGPASASAIFLHVGTGTATAGCVSLPTSELVKVMRWLRPGARPRISISAR